MRDTGEDGKQEINFTWPNEKTLIPHSMDHVDKWYGQRNFHVAV